MPETVAGRFCLAWPDRLSLYDMNRLVRAKRTCSIPDELGRLAGKGICMTSEEAYSLIEQLYALWEKLGFYPLDPDREPMEWTQGDEDLPPCVLATTESMYVDVNDMDRIVALYKGTNLPDYLPENERQARLRRQQRRLVMTTQCREPGCDEMVAITIGMAGRAIVEHKLREKGDVYEPSTLCKTHRLARDAKLAEKRANGGRLSAPVGEHVSAKGKARGAAKAAKGRARKAATATPENATSAVPQEASQEESSCADQNVAVDSVPEVTSALPAPQPEAESAVTT